MQVEVALIRQTTMLAEDKGLHREARAWFLLFDHRYINRTLVGILMMFFQREFYSPWISGDQFDL